MPCWSSTFFELNEEVLRWNYVAAGALDRLHIERGVLGLAGLRVPHAVVLALEQARELLHAVVAVLLLAHALRPAEVIRERHELGAVAEVAIAPAVAIGRGDGRGAQGAAVIAALEGEHQALALLVVAHQLETVLDGLTAAHVEMDAAPGAEFLLGVPGDDGGELDLLAMQVLARHLGKTIERAPHRCVEARIAVAEVHRRVPHLQIEEGAALGIEQERALAGVENLGRIDVVHRIAVRAVPVLQGQELRLRQPLLLGAQGSLGGAVVPHSHRLAHLTRSCCRCLL